jgi:hypothetical protein
MVVRLDSLTSDLDASREAAYVLRRFDHLYRQAALQEGVGGAEAGHSRAYYYNVDALELRRTVTGSPGLASQRPAGGRRVGAKRRHLPLF